MHGLKKLKKKLYGPFLWMGFNCLKARATSRIVFTFKHTVHNWLNNAETQQGHSKIESKSTSSGSSRRTKSSRSKSSREKSTEG